MAMTSRPPQIELAGIERVFQLGDSEVHALRHLDVSIAAGEYVAVMGPSGSGKSTLLNLVGLLDRPDAGTYRLEGRDVTTLSAEEQAHVRSERIGFVFQSFHLVPRLTASENIALPMTLAGIVPKERTLRVAQALRDYGLEDRAQHRPDQLSGGQRQRVAIARAIVRDPSLLLLDEATSALDAENETSIQAALERIMKERTTLVIAHRLATVINADRTIILNEGKIEASGTHSQLLESNQLYRRLAELQFSE